MITNAYISTFKYHLLFSYKSKGNQSKRLRQKHLTLVVDQGHETTGNRLHIFVLWLKSKEYWDMLTLQGKVCKN